MIEPSSPVCKMLLIEMKFLEIDQLDLLIFLHVAKVPL